MPETTSATESEIVERFRERIRFFAARHFHRPDEAEDIAQETLRRVIEAMRNGRLRDPSALPGFVFQTARNLCLQRGRNDQREEAAVARFTPHEQRRADEASPDPLLALIGQEERIRVRRALEQLDPADRDLLLAFYAGGDAAADLARSMRLEPGTLRVRKHRALRRLAALLRAEHREPVTPLPEGEPVR